MTDQEIIDMVKFIAICLVAAPFVYIGAVLGWDLLVFLYNRFVKKYINTDAIKAFFQIEELPDDQTDNMSSTTTSDVVAKKVVVASQSDNEANNNKTENVTTLFQREKIDILIEAAVQQSQIETVAKVLHLSKQIGKPLPETKTIERVCNVTAGTSKRWQSIREAVTRELEKLGPIEDVKKERNADRLVSVGGPGHRLEVPEVMTQDEQKIVEQAKEKHGDQVETEKQPDTPEIKKTDNDDALKYKPLTA